MGGWGWFYYCFANSHALRLQALTQFWCSGSDCPPNIYLNGGAIPISPYDYVSARLGMNYDERWQALGWMFFILALFRMVGILALPRVNHQKR